MKKGAGICALLICLCGFNSFKPSGDNDYYRNDCNLLAVVEGKNFELRDNDKYHAELLYKSSSMSGTSSLKKQVDANIIFFGNALKDENGNPWNEKLEFEYSFADGALGDAADVNVQLSYDRKTYYMLADGSQMKITRVDWSADRRSFILNAEFDCQLRKWGYPADTQPTVHLKGKMENITVSVPAWINMKNPNQQAEGSTGQ